jgi:hypothetical protein
VPEPADELLPQTKQWWRSVWDSPVAALWLEADIGALERLAWLTDLTYRAAPQRHVLSEIRQLEDRFGLSPLARRRLQLELGQPELEAVPTGNNDDRWLRFLKDGTPQGDTPA